MQTWGTPVLLWGLFFVFILSQKTLKAKRGISEITQQQRVTSSRDPKTKNKEKSYLTGSKDSHADKE